MAKTARDKIYEAIANGKKRKRHWQKTGPTTVVGGNYHWLQFGNQPAAYAYAGAVPIKVSIDGGDSPSITGGIVSFPEPTSPAQTHLTYGLATGLTASAFGLLKIIDIEAYYRFDTNSSSNQDPTGAAVAGSSDLARYDGSNTILFVDAEGTLGATPSNLVVTYTNQAGTGSKTTPSMAMITGTIKGRIAHSNYFIPLAAGDTGVKSVQRIKLDAAMGLAVNAALVLAEELAEIEIVSTSSTSHLFGEVNWVSDQLRFERLMSGAGISFVWIPGAAVTTPSFVGTLEAVEVDLVS